MVEKACSIKVLDKSYSFFRRATRGEGGACFAFQSVLHSVVIRALFLRKRLEEDKTQSNPVRRTRRT